MRFPSALSAWIRALPSRAARAHGGRRHARRVLAGGPGEQCDGVRDGARMSAEGPPQGTGPLGGTARSDARGDHTSDALLHVSGLARYFDVSPPWLNRVLERRGRVIL